MLRIPAFICMLLMVIAGAVTGCDGGGITEVTFDQLFSSPGTYNNKDVTIEGFFFQGFETIVLSERLEYSGFAPGHLTPSGRMLWISGGIPKDVYDKLDQQQMMGPTERYGMLRITGKFEYGGKYGHLGGFDHQITPTAATILPWSPPASGTLKEGFAIYLTREDIPPARIPALSHIDIADKPLVDMNDVIRYNAQTFELRLTASAYERISRLEVPVTGKTFVVCVDRKPVYSGAFWPPISSLSFDGVTIWKPVGSQEAGVITFELGYPSPSFYGGEDPRNNPDILRSLEQAGKLIARLSVAEVDRLPRSVKGYELYSWSENSEWHFTLITGTNRSKTVEEIISGEDFISEVGWVRLHVLGSDAIEAVLAKLQPGEGVLWLPRPPAVQTPSVSVNFMLSPGSVVDSIKVLAEQQNLGLHVQSLS